MEATVMDFRHDMKNIIKALDRNESVDVLYRGHLKGTIVPRNSEASKVDVKLLPGFGLMAEDSRSVVEMMDALRRERFDDLR